ncbi:MAG TPA: tripartite tricarboxylate transporter substrate binding protein [Burkholderiales bacterium]
MLFRCFVFALGALAAGAAAAQAFPDRPIKIIVPLPPGGSPDTLARTLSQGLGSAWSQPVVVENRTGGSQNIGADAVAKSPPDGYTWLLAPDNVFSVNPYITKQAFDALNDLAPVTELARIQFLLVVHPSLPVKSVQELVAYARSHPGELNYGSSGNGSPQHLGGVLFERTTGVRMNHVPYKGAAPVIADLVPGRIQLFIGAANQLLPHIREGRLRLLASTAAQRFPNLGDVPTVAEAGAPGYALDPWLGLFVAARTPADIVSRIGTEVGRLLNEPQLKARLGSQGIEVLTNSPGEFAHFVRDDNAKWGKLIKEAGIKAE